MLLKCLGLRGKAFVEGTRREMKGNPGLLASVMIETGRLVEDTIKETNTIHFWLPVCLGSLGEHFLEDNAKHIRVASQKHCHPAAQD